MHIHELADYCTFNEVAIGGTLPGHGRIPRLSEKAAPQADFEYADYHTAISGSLFVYDTARKYTAE